jgi:hypothetical protein
MPQTANCKWCGQPFDPMTATTWRLTPYDRNFCRQICRREWDANHD